MKQRVKNRTKEFSCRLCHKKRDEIEKALMKIPIPTINPSVRNYDWIKKSKELIENLKKNPEKKFSSRNKARQHIKQFHWEEICCVKKGKAFKIKDFGVDSFISEMTEKTLNPEYCWTAIFQIPKDKKQPVKFVGMKPPRKN